MTNKSKKVELAELLLRDTVLALQAADSADVDTAIAARIKLKGAAETFAERRRKIDDVRVKIANLTRSMLDLEEKAYKELNINLMQPHELLTQIIDDGQSSDVGITALIGVGK